MWCMITPQEYLLQQSRWTVMQYAYNSLSTVRAIASSVIHRLSLYYGSLPDIYAAFLAIHQFTCYYNLQMVSNVIPDHPYCIIFYTKHGGIVAHTHCHYQGSPLGIGRNLINSIHVQTIIFSEYSKCYTLQLYPFSIHYVRQKTCNKNTDG